MNTKIVYQCDRDGYLVGEAEADESPLEPGEFHIPGGCVEAKPPEPENSQQVPRFVDGAWILEDVPEEPEPQPEPEPEPEPLTEEKVQSMRRAAYSMESDHMKVEAEYDAILAGTEPDYAAWLAKVAEIKERYPLPESDAT